MGYRYVHRVFEDVVATEDVLYRTTTDANGNQIELRLDIYEPAGDTLEERPAVFWMFGGAWIAGSRQQMTSYAQDSARRGYVGITIDYRIRPGAAGEIVDAAWDAYEDSVAAAQWIADNAEDYGIDPDAIVAGGISAGAINSIHLLYAPGSRPPVDESPIAGAIPISGLSFVGPPDEIRPPAMMHNAVDDPIVPYSSAEDVCNAALAVGSECWLNTWESGGHSIGGTQANQIRLVAGLQTFAYVLYPLDYPVTVLPLA